VLVVRATRVSIKFNSFMGGYDDNVHVPSSNTLIYRNLIKDADLHGIIIVQEPPAQDGTVPPATNNSIIGNIILNSGDVGIEIQGDSTLITDNRLFDNIEYGVRICGTNSTDCDFPGGVGADANDTIVSDNFIRNSDQGGVLDDGVGTVNQNNIVLKRKP
jgi:parallel beta-helix repeat protein